MKLTKKVEKMQISDDDDGDDVTTVVSSSDDETASLHSTDLETENKAENNLPKNTAYVCGFNCPEKIVFVLDTSWRMGLKCFSSDDKTVTNMTLAKKSIEMFITMKSMLNAKHEFAVAIAQNLSNPFILQGFTNDIKTIMGAMDDIDFNQTEEAEKNKTSYIDSLVDMIDENSLLRRHLPTPFPDHVTRFILIGSQTQLDISADAKLKLKEMYNAEDFFFDSLLIRTDNHAVDVYKRDDDTLRQLNFRNENHNLTVSRNQAEFFNQMSRLLSHPLQRSRCF